VSTRTVVTAALMVVILGGCGTKTESQRPGETASPIATPEHLIDVLAASGIAVYESDTATEPVREPRGRPSPLALLKTQVDALAAQDRGGGMLGTDIDALARSSGLPEDPLPFSFVIAGWLTADDSSAAKEAKALIGEQDWTRASDVVFPDVVILLFMSDFASQMAADAGSAAGPRSDRFAESALSGLVAVGGPRILAPPDPAALSLCSSLEQWIDSTMGGIFDLLKVPSGDGFFGKIASAWNAGVDFVKNLVVNAAKAVLNDLLGVVRQALLVVGLASYIASFLKAWTVSITADPPAVTHFQHPGQEPHRSTLTASVNTAGQESWSDLIKDCAKAANVTIPDAAAPGKKVDWEAFSQPKVVATLENSDPAVGADRKARTGYVAQSEDPEDVAGQLKSGTFNVEVKVHRIDADQLQKLIESIFLGGDAGDILKLLLGEATKKISTEISDMAVPHGTIKLSIGFHEATQLCLSGVWTADLISYKESIQNVIGSAGVIKSIDGLLQRTYLKGGHFIERQPALLIAMERHSAGHFIQTTMLVAGQAVGDFGLIVDDQGVPTGTVAYTNIKGEYFSSGRVTVDGAASSGGFTELPSTGISNGSRTTTCDGDVMTERFYQDKISVTWHRVSDTPLPDGEQPDPSEFAGPLGAEASATVNGVKMKGGSCSWYRLSGHEYFNINVEDAKDPLSAAPANSFHMSIEAGPNSHDVEFGDSPPSGTVSGSAFFLKPTGTMSLSGDRMSGSFSGNNIDEFGGGKVSGSFKCA